MVPGGYGNYWGDHFLSFINVQPQFHTDKLMKLLHIKELFDPITSKIFSEEQE